MASQAISFDAPLQQPQTISVPASGAPPNGVTFDAPTTQPTSVAMPGQPSSQPQTDIQDTAAQNNQAAQPFKPEAMLSAVPNNTTAEQIRNWANSVAGDLKYGTTTTTLGTLLHKMGAQPLENGVSPGVADFMGSLPLGLLKSIQGSAELTQSGHRWQGTKDTVGGVLQAGTIPGSFVAPEAGPELAGAGIDQTAAQAARAAKAVRGVLSPQSVQPKLQGAIRDAMQQTAQEHGASIPDVPSIRDVAQSLSDTLRAKAHDVYQQLDSALGGTRFQAFDEQLQNINKAIRDSLGIEPEKDKALAERLDAVTKARNAAMDDVRAKGLDPEGLISKANGLHQKAMALGDVSKAIRQSTDGLNPGLVRDGVKATPETIKTAPLFKRLNNLATPNPKYPGSPSRLAQAIGEDRAAALLQAVDEAHLAAQKIAARNQFVKSVVKTLGLGTLGYEAVKGAHDVLSSQ